MAAPSFRLWHCVGARSFRCLWAMTELELPASSYELITMPFPPRVSVGMHSMVPPSFHRPSTSGPPPPFSLLTYLHHLGIVHSHSGKKYVQKTGGLGTIPYFEDLSEWLNPKPLDDLCLRIKCVITGGLLHRC